MATQPTQLPRSPLRFLTEDAVLTCAHITGRISNRAIQPWVRVEGRRVLVEDDPEGRSISACSNTNVLAGMVPCTTTLKVQQGYSSFVRVDGRPMCLETVTGLTNGTPPGTVMYSVRSPGQSLVRSTP